MNHTGIEYEVEGGIDFFSQLKQMTTPGMASPAAANNTATAAEPRCLITDEPLRRDHITLQCGHKFNYVPLFKDVLFQKCSLLPKNLSSNIITTYTTTSNASASSSASASALSSAPLSMNQAQTQKPGVHSVMYNSSYNLETTKLQYNEIKCPYCRTITPNILPYYPYPDVTKVKYVNVPPNLSLPGVSCEYELSSCNNTVFATNETASSCRSPCIYNEKYGLMLCNKHLNKLETCKPAASAATRKRKRVSDPNDENVIISHHNPATSVCSFVLLSGPRKGCPCGKPMWIPKTPPSSVVDEGLPAYCKVHWGKHPPTVLATI